MSEVVENVNEQNSAQNNEEAALPAEAVVDVTPNNVDAVVKAVPEAVETTSPAKIKNADDSGSKDVLGKVSTSPKVDNKKTPAKRTPSKRMSFIERAQKESEELVKNMGGSLEIEGGRKTRSSTRGTATASPALATPPPAKKARASPASGASTPTRPRGRGRKIDVAADEVEEEETKSTPSKKKTPVKGEKVAAKEDDKDAMVVEKPEAEEAKHDEQKPEEESQQQAGITESNPVADENKETPAISEQRIDESQKEDVTDAALEPVVEETQSQVLAADSQPTEKHVTNEPENVNITAEVVLEISESAKSDSPMDTDIEIVEEKIQEKPKVPEPMFEPMEIDSSPSNDDDVVEINEEPDVVSEPRKSSESEQPSTAHNNIEEVEEISIGHSVVPPAGIIANNLIEKPVAAAADVANASESISEETNFATNKTENDLCEPKIATSPKISASSENSSVTTPQFCN